MPQIKKRFTLLPLLMVGIVSLFGCSDPNTNSVFSADTGHPAGWLPAGHMQAAKADVAVCAECHGEDYSGGISEVSCTSCHLGGVISVHPTAWGTAVALNHGPYVQANGNTACANAVCHGTSLAGVAESGPACTSCHLGSASSIHPVSWGTGSQIVVNHAPYVTSNGAAGCSTVSCHGSTLQGGIGPACSSCHVNGSPLSLTGCTSCHANPPSGSVAPNRAGAHNATTGHFAPQVSLPDSCNTCHSGAGSGTLIHDNGNIDVAFLNAYNAKSGAAVRNSDGTCTNVSCHGAQKTPAWLTGKIDVTTQCTSCHAFGTAQYNSFNSGQHFLHAVEQGILCTTCHDTSKLVANHFKYLNTSILEGPAAATIQDTFGFDGVTCSTPGCHEARVW